MKIVALSCCVVQFVCLGPLCTVILSFLTHFVHGTLNKLDALQTRRKELLSEPTRKIGKNRKLPAVAVHIDHHPFVRTALSFFGEIQFVCSVSGRIVRKMLIMGLGRTNTGTEPSNLMKLTPHNLYLIMSSQGKRVRLIKRSLRPKFTADLHSGPQAPSSSSSSSSSFGSVLLTNSSPRPLTTALPRLSFHRSPT